MKRKDLGRMIVGMAIAASSVGATCNKVPKDSNDATKPTVAIKVRGSDGQYAPASTATMSASQAGKLDIMCVVDDPQGVKSISLNLVGHSDICSLGDTWGEGGYSFTPVPTDLFQDLSGDPNGVLTTLPLLATVTGPFKCTVPSPPAPNGPQDGVPLNGKLTVTCTGKNWSSDATHSTASTQLVITLK